MATTTDPPVRLSDAPFVQISHLDQLWFQAAGTLCNLACTHCFISCSPHNHAFGFLTLIQVEAALAESVVLGVQEYYFTGGEPVLNRDMPAMLASALQYGPATVLTNGTVLRDEWLAELAKAEAASLYTLEFRVSIDGYSAETNDPVRGPGTFERAMHGIEQLLRHGFLPIVTATRVWHPADEANVFARLVEVLRERGYGRPRIKLLPTLQLGAETERTHGYTSDERVTPAMMEEFDRTQLVCEHSRVVTDRGVYVCPILLDEPTARLSDTLGESLRPFQIAHGACFTCYQYGAICSNAASSPGRAQAAGAQ
jgi:molybdenum cofactor biosynthesis enzyme MoaA